MIFFALLYNNKSHAWLVNKSLYFIFNNAIASWYDSWWTPLLPLSYSFFLSFFHFLFPFYFLKKNFFPNFLSLCFHSSIFRPCPYLLSRLTSVARSKVMFRSHDAFVSRLRVAKRALFRPVFFSFPFVSFFFFFLLLLFSKRYNVKKMEKIGEEIKWEAQKVHARDYKERVRTPFATTDDWQNKD